MTSTRQPHQASAAKGHTHVRRNQPEPRHRRCLPFPYSQIAPRDVLIPVWFTPLQNTISDGGRTTTPPFSSAIQIESNQSSHMSLDIPFQVWTKYHTLSKAFWVLRVPKKINIRTTYT